MAQTSRNRCNSAALTGNVTQREDFPEQDAVGPHVTLKGVDTVENTLGRHPLDGQTGLQEGEQRLQEQHRPYFVLFCITPKNIQ